MPQAAPPDSAFDDLGLEVRRLFNQLRAAAETIHADHEALPIAQRAILESLHRDGPATVPALARARPVSRQHVQILVNALAGAGLVETRPNPGHRRSPFVALTPAGRRLFTAMRTRERRAVYGSTAEKAEKHFIGWLDDVDPDELFATGKAWGLSVVRRQAD